MSDAADSLALLLDGGGEVHPELVQELEAIWRRASETEGNVLRAWFSGDATYEAFVAALDREQAAAYTLAVCVRASQGAKEPIAPYR